MAGPDLDAQSEKLLIHIKPSDIAMFRFLLEAHENLAIFTCLERRTALLKLVFYIKSGVDVIKALEDMQGTIEISWRDWPIKSK